MRFLGLIILLDYPLFGGVIKIEDGKWRIIVDC
jgi:hypothetical protein